MTPTSESLDAIIARTALKYDLLPYDSKPFAQSQPSRIGGIARLFGLEAAPLKNARVLELGCASGGNLIPHAARYPEATFVGVDLARTQVAAGRARIERLGLTNVEILCKSFTEIGEELGSFDYIVCHGVFSWVPPQVRDIIMQVIRDRLSPVGVACVSYNVLPGWRMMQPVRDAFLKMIPDGIDIPARVARTREVLGFLAETTPDKGPYGESLKAWNNRLSHLSGDYIAHEFLEECNEPMMLADFAASATKHGLGYLGECEVAAMILSNYDASLAEQVRARSGNDLVANEQWLDLLTGRTFRQSILVAQERMTRVNRSLTTESLAGLHFILPGGSKSERDGEKATLSVPGGKAIASTMPVVADALEKMAGSLPGSTAQSDLVADKSADEAAAINDALYRMVIAGMAHVSSEPAECTVELSDMPKASLLARSDAEAGADMTASVRHEAVRIDPVARVVLPMLDGSTARKAIVSKLVKEAKAGRITYSRDGEPVKENGALKSTVEEHLQSLLPGLAAAGLLEA